MGVDAVGLDEELAGTLAGGQDAVVLSGRLEHQRGLGALRLLDEVLSALGRADLLIAVEEKAELLVGQQTFFLQELHGGDRHHQAALAVDGPEAVADVTLDVEGVICHVARVEHRVQVAVEQDLAVGVALVQRGDHHRAQARLNVADRNAGDLAQQRVHNLHDLRIALQVSGAAVNGRKSLDGLQFLLHDGVKLRLDQGQNVFYTFSHTILLY